MFGDRTKAKSGQAAGRDYKHPEPSPDRDPTLPQFRPDESAPPSPPPLPNPFAGDPISARKTYDLWLRHDEIDLEAKQRGGYGKLGFNEFRRKMVPEDEGNKAPGGKENRTRVEKEPEAWESSADLGRLAFVGTWLEMASF